MRGDYASILPRWRKHFGADRVHVAFYEDLVEDPEGLLRGIFRFLGARTDLAPGFPALHDRVNATAAMEMPDEIRRTLARQYREALRELCRMEPGRAETWLRETEALTAPGSVS
jgi:hypothetical protein